MTTTTTKTVPFETRHALAEDERQIEQSVLAAIHQLFSNPAGDQRATYDVMIAATPIAEGVAVEAVDRDGVRGWWVRPAGAPPDRAILFLHGGAYMLGSAEAYRGLASQVAVRAGVAAFVADYPLAPERCSPPRRWPTPPCGGGWAGKACLSLRWWATPLAAASPSACWATWRPLRRPSPRSRCSRPGSTWR